MRSLCLILTLVLLLVTIGVPALAEAAISFDASLITEIGSKAECGPYTVEKLADGVFHIEDGIDAYKPGVWLNEDGTYAYDENGNYMNNCSDMYLVVGDTGALLIDLSNFIERDDASNALRAICDALRGDKPLEIAITHGHGDHIGMAATFTEEAIWFPENDYADYFETYYKLSKDRLSLFAPGDKVFDLGGRTVSTVKVSGHTVDSTVFVLDNENIMFSGDAIGSGSGVWIWGVDGLKNFAEGAKDLFNYIVYTYAPEDFDKIKIYGGHAWQCGKFVEGGADYLDWKYVKDANVCIDLIKDGAWVKEDSGLIYSDWGYQLNGLTGDFIYGSFAVSAGLEAACDYAGVTAEGKKKSDYPWGEYLKYDDKISFGSTYENGKYLDLYEERTYASGEEAVGDLTYYVYDPIANGADPNGVYPVIFWFHGAGNAIDGKIAVAYGGAEYYASPEYQEKMGGAYIIAPLANEYRTETGANAGTWMTPSADGKTSLYSTALKGLLDAEMANFGEHAGKLLISGTSAGGYCAWRYIIDHTEDVSACFIMAGAYLPTDDELKKIDDAGIRMWIIQGYHDELVTYDWVMKPILEKLMIMENVEVTIFEWVRNGNKAIATLAFGIEMGQHCICAPVGGNLIYDDGTPYDISHPEGVTGWIRDVVGE